MHPSRWLSLALALTAIPCTLAGVAGYYRFPTLNDNHVVFAAENDLWRVPIDGGLAQRLTTDEGNEAFPKFSPDGKWLAYSAEYEGNVDVYVMPADGGQPQRLTFHPDRDEVVAWKHDSSAIVFRSRRQDPTRDLHLYAVPREGGPATMVPLGIGALADFAPDGRHVAFNRLSREFRTWKRYMGGRAQEVWIGDLEAGKFWKLTDWRGTDRFPMWGNDRVYFLSDRDGRLNIHSLRTDGNHHKQHTFHTEFDARWADLHGHRIVYMLGADLWLLDLNSGESKAIPIELPSDRERTRPRFVPAERLLESYDLSHDGNRIALSSRGEIFVRPVREGRTINLTRSTRYRERRPSFSPDGKLVAAISDASGEQEIVLLDAAGKAPLRTLTNAGQGWLFSPIWSPDNKHIAYADLTLTLYVVDVETGERTTVSTSPAWETRQYAFSPDGKWLAYVEFIDSGITNVYLYELSTGKKTAVTDRFTNDFDIAWDPSGRYLYFLSERAFNPVISRRDFAYADIAITKPCVVVLKAGDVSPFAPEELQPEDPEKKKDKDESEAPETDGDEQDESQADSDKELPKVIIDLDGITDRIIEFPVTPGEYDGLQATKQHLYYISGPVRGLVEGRQFSGNNRRVSNLQRFDFEKKEAQTLIDKLDGYTISGDGSTLAYLVDRKISVISTKGKPAPDDTRTVDPHELPLRIIPADEWAQMFDEVFRLQRDFYWVENMAGTDWDAERERYAALLPRVGTRHELSDLIGQFIGELGTSHTYVWGGDTKNAPGVAVGLLGADISPSTKADAHRIDRVLRAEPWETDILSPLAAPHANVTDGSYLFAINNVDLGAGDNVYEHLANLANCEVLLTVGTQPDRSDARDIQIRTLSNERRLRYRDWVRRNRELVLEQTHGRVGYMHIPDMGGNGLVEFTKAFYPQVRKEGLIVDVRANGGGFVSQLLIERLARKPAAFWKARRGPIGTYPEFTHRGPKVCLLNENAGSDGDIFPDTFQNIGLGPVIGMRSWGGVIGIRGDKQLIDGGTITQPEFSWWEPQRGFGLENSGVDPDIEVLYRPEDYLSGVDPQLKRGIAEVLRQLEENPVKPVEFDAIPDRSRNAMPKP
jgi:tricorn protease